MVGGFAKDYVEKLEAQAMRVREKLCNAIGWGSLWVRGLLVFVEPNLTVKEQPHNVVVRSDEELVPGLLQQPQKLSPARWRCGALVTHDRDSPSLRSSPRRDRARANAEADREHKSSG